MAKQTKQKEVIGEAQRELKQDEESGPHVGCPSENWVRHIFKEHNTVDDRWAERGVQGEETLRTTGKSFGW